ncbi:uncharacterized protein JCM6883_005870 [Sporobolomyces salmoneus]|uniref:uncharacterized protein n=1 Tax=Sporobolomyces salmoneus TaxID=183962 RepID=UPI00316F07FB
MLLEPFLLLALVLYLLHHWYPPSPAPKPPLPSTHRLAKRMKKHGHTIKRKGWPRQLVKVEGIVKVE